MTPRSLPALVLALALLAGPGRAAPAPTVQASSALLVDAVTGQVLFEKNAHERRPVASTTKIMTALLTLESGRLDEVAVASKQASQTPMSALCLAEGEQMTVRDLLTGLLVKSANDAAVALAEHLAGSVPAFADRMNERARRLGCTDTHFVNPNGLYDPQHYSSACDLALMARAALRHDLFRRLVATRVTTVPEAGKPWDRTLINKNRLLTELPGGDGIKTGYVKESGHCLVGSATRGGWQLVVVLLNSPDSFAEAKALLETGFAQYRPVVFARAGRAAGAAPIRGGRLGRLPVIAGETLQHVTPITARPPLRAEYRLTRRWAPFRRGERVGREVLLAGDRELRSVPLYAAVNVGRAWWAAIWHYGVRAVALLVILALGVRTYAKAAKAARKSRRRRQARLGAAYPRGPRPR